LHEKSSVFFSDSSFPKGELRSYISDTDISKYMFIICLVLFWIVFFFSQNIAKLWYTFKNLWYLSKNFSLYSIIRQIKWLWKFGFTWDIHIYVCVYIYIYIYIYMYVTEQYWSAIVENINVLIFLSNECFYWIFFVTFLFFLLRHGPAMYPGLASNLLSAV
jgi:hypothetical protein